MLFQWDIYEEKNKKKKAATNTRPTQHPKINMKWFTDLQVKAYSKNIIIIPTSECLRRPIFIRYDPISIK